MALFTFVSYVAVWFLILILTRVVLVVHLIILSITKLTVMFYGIMVLMNCFLVNPFFSRLFI